MRKNLVLLIFGYPLNYDHFGGLVWIKRVTDYIEKNNLLSVRKVSSYFDANKHAFQHLVHLRAVLEGSPYKPQYCNTRYLWRSHSFNVDFIAAIQAIC